MTTGQQLIEMLQATVKSTCVALLKRQDRDTTLVMVGRIFPHVAPISLVRVLKEAEEEIAKEGSSHEDVLPPR